MFAWDDIGVFLALYRGRTTGRAAAELGCSQPTVVRRLAALEHGLGLTLFERTPVGVTPTDAAEALLPLAQEVERAVCNFSSEVSARTGAGMNILRLTFLDHFERLLIPILRDFRNRWPAIQTELLASDRIYDLARGEADIAIRGRDCPASDELVVHRLPPGGWSVFASAHVKPSQRPSSREELRNFPLALLDGPASKLPVYQWLESMAQQGPPPIRCSSLAALRSAIASGAAISILPWTKGYRDADLVACFPPMTEFDVDLYLIARRMVLRRPPARDLFDSIAAFFASEPEMLSGPRD